MKPDDIYEALNLMVATNVHGMNQKQIAMLLRPTKTADQAKTWLSRCLREDGDMQFSPADIKKLCHVTGRAEILVNFLCDVSGFERPAKKLTPLSPEKELQLIKKILAKEKITIDIDKHVISLEARKEGEDHVG